MTIVAVLALAQVQPPARLPVISPWPYTRPFKITRSDSWITTRKKNLERVSALNARTRDARLKFLKDFAENVQVRGCPADDAYFAAHLLIAFGDECLAANIAGNLCTAVTGSTGSMDQEFLRTAYTAVYIIKDHTNCASLGSQLRKIFPDDKELELAFIIDCGRGYNSVAEKRVGREILHKRWKSRLSKLDYYDFAGRIDFALLELAKEQKYKATAIEFFELALAEAKTDRERHPFKIFLDYLKKKK